MVRKLMLVAVVAMLVLPTMASAQSDQVAATATVLPTFALTGSGDLAFGDLSAVTDNVISAIGGATVRTLSFNHDVAVTFTNVPAALSSGSLTPLPVTLMCASSVGGSWSSEQVCSSASLNLTVGAEVTQAILGFGGTIAAADVAAAAAGSYTATFDIVVTAR